MNIYLRDNVYEAAKKRVAYLFDEFDDVIVNMSGGKDSTVVYNLCLEEAERRGRLPLGVLFVDQEAEWQATIDYIKSVMYDKRVKPMWYQVPIKLFNATSHEADNWLHCWWPGEEWMREKDPISIKENTYGTDRFKELFTKILDSIGSNGRVCFVTGMRAEESPNRRAGLTQYACYKHITWGKPQGSSYTFHPIYDWSFSDVWHAIAVNKWKYNKIYDGMYRLGVPANSLSMRVSNLNHETAVRSLYQVQELEPRTWDKLVRRMNGIETTRGIKFQDNFQAPRELPFMFKSWKEYRDFLLEKLVSDPAQKAEFKRRFDKMDKELIGSDELFESGCKVAVSSILANDYTGTKIHNFMLRPATHAYKRVRSGNVKPADFENNATAAVIKEVIGEGAD